MKIGTVFLFDPPKDWTELRDGMRYVFHGSNREELIVSASIIQGIGILGELEALKLRLFQNTEKSVKNAAAHPALKVTQPFQKKSSISTPEYWTLLAETHDGGVIFYQALFPDTRGVLLATLESPKTAEAVNTFEQIIKSVRLIADANAPNYEEKY